MRIDSRDGLKGTFVRDDGGKIPNWVIWWDDETKEYEAFKCDPKQAKKLGIDPNAIKVRGKAPLRFVPFVGPKLLARPEPRNALTTHPPRRRGRSILALAGRECMEPCCHRLAVYATIDQRLIEPELGSDGRLHERAMDIPNTERHWCEYHYRLPRETSRRGVESEVQVACARNEWKSL